MRLSDENDLCVVPLKFPVFFYRCSLFLVGLLLVLLSLLALVLLWCGWRCFCCLAVHTHKQTNVLDHFTQLEYDLDLYNIVAVDNFNMGAMENKSLNVFNTAYVLADEATATDTDFERVEAVNGHEYLSLVNDSCEFLQGIVALHVFLAFVSSLIQQGGTVGLTLEFPRFSRLRMWSWINAESCNSQSCWPLWRLLIAG